MIGLTNTVREHSGAIVLKTTRPAGTASAHASSSCETPYVTRKELFKFVSKGVGFPYGSGGGPGCSGLTPDQTNSIYGAPKVGPRGKGAGATAAVFELSAFLRSDISTWTNQFYGSGYQPPLGSRLVDGGPLHPQCPPGDKCPRSIEGYTGAAEVNADIEMELAVAPDLHKLIVYDAPNDFSGQTELDEYTAMAQDDTAATISSSWSVCENDVTAAYVQSENVVFEQMALQGQSVFVDNQDTGAFGCIRSDGTHIPNVQDPSSQPWVTSVGGTSLESKPRHQLAPRLPAGRGDGLEHRQPVQRPQARTVQRPAGRFLLVRRDRCGGGGPSQWWGRPFYQFGPGVNSKYSTVGNGTTQCALASVGTPCRETPDISANADPYTGYAEYCTGNSRTPHS